MNKIKISNIHYKTEAEGAYSDHLVADVEIDGVISVAENFDFITFFADSHFYDFLYMSGSIPERIKKLPMLNFIKTRQNDTNMKIDLRLTEEELSKLPKTKKFRNKAKQKIIATKKKNAKINPSFLQQRENRNLYFLDFKKCSDFYFNTCSCGVHECAGIWNGIAIHRSFKNKTFTYSVVDKTDGYSRNGILHSKKDKLTFSERDILTIRKQLLPFFPEVKLKK